MTTATEAVTLEVIEDRGVERDEIGWRHNAYKVKLSYQGRTMTSPWRQGLGVEEEPDAARVLESMLSDAAGFENARSFEEWAAEYGYDDEDPEARKRNERTYRAVEKQTEKLERLLGDDYRGAVFPEEGGAASSAWHLGGEPEPREGFRLGTAPGIGPVWVEVRLEGHRLAITGWTLDGGGQNIDDARAVDEFAPGWNEASRDYLVGVWERWHLNDMRAGCEHQRALGWTDYDEHPSEPCPVCGYKFGSAWRTEDLPADVRAWAEHVSEHGRPPEAADRG